MAMTATEQQDTLRPVRNFISLLSGATSDQTYGDTDAYACGYPGQFAVQGPTGVAQEGQPVVIQASASAQGVSLSNPIVLIGLGLLAYMLLK